jgi:hypothetical protein
VLYRRTKYLGLPQILTLCSICGKCKFDRILYICRRICKDFVIYKNWLLFPVLTGAMDTWSRSKRPFILHNPCHWAWLKCDCTMWSHSQYAASAWWPWWCDCDYGEYHSSPTMFYKGSRPLTLPLSIVCNTEVTSCQPLVVIRHLQKLLVPYIIWWQLADRAREPA